MKEEAKEKISAKVLSERLSELTQLAIVVRERDFFNPKFVQYYLTDYGQELRNLINHIRIYEEELLDSERLELYQQIKFRETAVIT
ncbi:MAG: hypothetical protein HeimC3_12530 [Candidatus Heimdallarchaeota archaeon LC_3]|nr:MAG: hypothetical protein HeimC3_12530 [Candidatus Heimdallarchaeota archaeon LC_3]